MALATPPATGAEFPLASRPAPGFPKPQDPKFPKLASLSQVKLSMQHSKANSSDEATTTFLTLVRPYSHSPFFPKMNSGTV